MDHRTVLLLAPERLLWHIEAELTRSLKSRVLASYETSEPAFIAAMNGLCSAMLSESPREMCWVAARMALKGRREGARASGEAVGADRTLCSSK